MASVFTWFVFSVSLALTNRNFFQISFIMIVVIFFQEDKLLNSQNLVSMTKVFVDAP